jgi:membrane-associated protease RseP (regulator of RpoE activity)
VSDLYRKLRDEIVAGGDTVDREPEGRVPWFTIAVLVGLLAWLGTRNPWTLLFVVGLLVSVFLHEMGHYSTARLTGMKVTQFYMGFGPRIWSRKRGELEYGVRALPLGAFVRIVGMNNLDDCDPADESRAYRNKSYPRRMLVITAGSLMHFVIAFCLFLGVFATAGRYGETGMVKVMELGVGASPAKSVGVEVGDVIVAFDGVRVTTWDGLVAEIRSHAPGDRVTVDLERDGRALRVETTLASTSRDPDVAYFGVATWSSDYQRKSLPAAVGWAAHDVADAAWRSVQGVFVVLNPVNLFDAVVSENPDPATRPTTVVGASQVGGELGRRDGLKGMLQLLAGVNVFVGVFNLFPLLPFDGGHAAIATYERLRSRRGRPYHADVAKMVPVATTVVAILVMLLLIGLYLDVTRPLL